MRFRVQPRDLAREDLEEICVESPTENEVLALLLDKISCFEGAVFVKALRREIGFVGGSL
ncbi:hypothetical protein BDV06DRAFT_188182 [Aspergillus oleicola]